jgi:hypothetical protein
MCKKSEQVKVRVHLDTTDTKNKPSSNQIPLINQRLNSPSVELSCEELAGMVGSPHSRTWVPAEFEGPRSNDNWKSQQLFALDFDGGIKLEEVLERLNEFGLSCNFCYSTFSSTADNPKFRVVFMFKDPIIIKAHRDEIMDALLMLFPEADKGCRDSARMFFGGREILFADFEYRLDLSDLLIAGEVYYLKGVSKNTKTKRLAELGKNPFPINNNIGSGNNPKIEEILAFDYGFAAEQVKIFDDFIKGEWLGHPQLFGIATNLVHVCGGLKHMKEVMDKTGKYTENNYNILPYVRKKKYYPQQLIKFSPYPEDHKQKNILTAVKLPKGSVQRTAQFKTITLEEGEEKLQEVLKQVRESDDLNIHVICASTGIGKTECILDWENVVMAFYDHPLKMEVDLRMKVDHVCTPNVMDYISEEDRTIINHCHLVGAHLTASRYIHTKAVKSGAYSLTDGETKYLEYLKELNKCNVSNTTILTTHAWIENAMIRQKEIIFDEDPSTSLFMRTHTAFITDINRLIHKVFDRADKSALSNIIELAIKAPQNTIINLPDFMFNDYSEIEKLAVQDTNISSNILGFFNCKHFVIDHDDPNKVYFIKRYFPPENKKIIILSATANELIYKQMFGERVKFHDLGNVEFKSKVVQDTSFTFSKQNLIRPDVLTYAKERAEDRMVITFKSLKKLFPNAYQDIHIGNCQGKDNYRDKSLAVIGTPHVNPAMYILYAKALELECIPEDFSRTMQRVTWNGVSFNFYAFDNERLRNLQFYLIERELKQAIGRIRPVRNPDGDVLLLSNFALPEAKQLNEI